MTPTLMDDLIDLLCYCIVNPCPGFWIGPHVKSGSVRYRIGMRAVSFDYSRRPR
jgi:hypothetical protein